MGEMAVGAHREDLHAQRLQFGVFGGNCREFGRSDEGEITRIETYQDPLAFVVGQLDRLEAATDKRHGFEIGGWLTYTCSHTDFLLK